MINPRVRLFFSASGRKKIIYVIAILACGYANSQTNFALNSGLENYTPCPTYAGNLSEAVHWSSSLNSPDYFNSCSSLPHVGVPSNDFGYQFAYEGNAYCGFATYANGFPYEREIPCVELSSPLQIGTKYFVSFKVVRAHSPSSIVIYSTNNFGFKLSVNHLYTGSIIDNNPKYNYNSVISDTVNWTLVKGSFIADSVYKYLMIGNFYDDAHTIMQTQVNPQFGAVAYYYLDDICLSTDSTLCREGEITKLNEYESSHFRILPNPSTGKIKISSTYNTVDFDMTVFSSEGKQVFNQNGLSNNSEVNLQGLSKGLYLIQLKDTENRIINKRLIIQ